MRTVMRIKLADAIAGGNNNQWLYDLGGAITVASGLYGGARALSDTLVAKNPNRYFYTPGIAGHVLDNSLRGAIAGLGASTLAGLAFSVSKNPVLAGLGTLGVALPLGLALISKKAKKYDSPTMGEYTSDPGDLNDLKSYLKNKNPESFSVTPEEYYSTEEQLSPGQYITNGEDL